MNRTILIAIGISCAVITACLPLGMATGCSSTPAPTKVQQSIISPTGLSQTTALTGKIQLAYRWEKGQIHRYQISQSMAGQIGAPGVEIKINGKIIFVISEKVIDLDESGAAIIEIKYESLKVKTTTPMGTHLSFNSTKKEDMDKALEFPDWFYYLLPNQKLTCKINSRGVISEINGIDKIIENLGEILRKKSDMAYAILSLAFTEESMRAFIQKNHPMLPPAPVVPGDTWESNDALSLPDFYTIREKVKRTYVGWETIDGKEYARINSQHDIVISHDIDPKLKVITERSDISGLTSFDIKSGVILKQEVVYDLNSRIDQSDSEYKRPLMSLWNFKVSTSNKLID